VVAAIQQGDVETLSRLLRDNPELARIRIGDGKDGLARTLLHIFADSPRPPSHWHHFLHARLRYEGIEPDFSLVKHKKLVGGGSMQIVNQVVPRALRRLGYQEEQVEAIVAYIAEHGHVVDAPGLKPEHYEIFDCAMGERSIKPMGHVRMMAVAQPFVSGAISKTVNLPESATVEDIENVYLQGWKLGSPLDERSPPSTAKKTNFRSSRTRARKSPNR